MGRVCRHAAFFAAKRRDNAAVGARKRAHADQYRPNHGTFGGRRRTGAQRNRVAAMASAGNCPKHPKRRRGKQAAAFGKRRAFGQNRYHARGQRVAVSDCVLPVRVERRQRFGRRMAGGAAQQRKLAAAQNPVGRRRQGKRGAGAAVGRFAAAVCGADACRRAVESVYGGRQKHTPQRFLLPAGCPAARIGQKNHRPCGIPQNLAGIYCAAGCAEHRFRADGRTATTVCRSRTDRRSRTRRAALVPCRAPAAAPLCRYPPHQLHGIDAQHAAPGISRGC